MPELGSCPTCTGAVSTQARKCPHCGQPLRPWAPKLAHTVRLVALVFAGFAALVVLIALTEKLPPGPPFKFVGDKLREFFE